MNTVGLPLKSLVITTFSAAALASPATASAQAANLVPFDQFVRQVAAAQTAAYVGPTQVSDIASFEEMRRHIVSLYSGVKVKHSFMLDDHPYDCVPIDQQPSVRLSDDHTIATPPDEAPEPSFEGTGVSPATQIDPAAMKDPLGNIRECEDGTIPMRRVTLDDVTRFKTLQAFFHMAPNGTASAGTRSPDAAAATSDIFAYGEQQVGNVGSSALITVWNTQVDTSKKEVASTQEFQVANGAEGILGGYVNLPQQFGKKTVLFLSFASRGGGGCINTACKGFVQTNKKIMLGASFTQYSKVGGPTVGYFLSEVLSKGKWWFYLKGKGPRQAIGYYPASVFKGAMSKGANFIGFGGEGVGGPSYPPVGDGIFPKVGSNKAADVLNIKYYKSASKLVDANLGGFQQSPKCYKAIVNNKTGKQFGTLVSYGGPGGKGC